MSENTNESNGEELVEEVTYTVEDAEVIPTPIDPTLTIPGEAADAKATGDAIRGMGQNLNINGVRADLSGTFALYPANIPMSSAQGAQTVDDVLTDIGGRTGSDIMLEDEGSVPIASAVAAIATAVEGKLDSSDIDSSLTETGKAADAKATGDAISALDTAAVKSVNQTLPDASGDVTLRVIPLADNLKTSKTYESTGTYAMRTTGGDVSLETGSAYLRVIRGNTVHTGQVTESIEMSVTPISREEGVDPITATIDKDVFRNYVDESGTTTLYYTTEWSASPALYGITVTGTPLAGDQISVVYVKADRGTIAVADFESFVSIGWNLFDYDHTRARVFRYSEQYGYYIGGDYTSVSYSATLSGERTAITVTDRLFTVPGAGWVFVEGAVETTTYIVATWSDWTSGSPNTFAGYEESTIDFTSLMSTAYPYGLLRVGSVYDEIDLDNQLAISQIERLAYTAENLAAAEASGRAYEADTDYIYLVRATPVQTSITIDAEYAADDHGYEIVYNTAVPVYVETLYGENLRNKLERDVVTFSVQTETAARKAQARTNIGAASTSDIETVAGKLLCQTGNWDTYPGETGQRFFKYEGANTTTYAIPYANVVVVVDWASETRGIAIAYRWANSGMPSMWINKLHGTWQGWENIHKTVDVSSSVTLTSTNSGSSFEQKTAYRTGNVVSLAFVFKVGTAISANGALGITATFSDATLKPINRQPGSTNVYTVHAINIGPGTGSNASCNAVATAGLSVGNTIWLTYTYVCAG